MVLENGVLIEIRQSPIKAINAKSMCLSEWKLLFTASSWESWQSVVLVKRVQDYDRLVRSTVKIFGIASNIFGTVNSRILNFLS